MTDQDKSVMEAELVAARKEIESLKAQNAALRISGKVNREAKNSVFLDMFGRKEYLIRMYRELHPEDQETTEDDLTVVTVENVLTIKPYNDLGVLLSRRTGKMLILAEAQARWSVNVLFRLWEYVVDTLMNYFINNGYSLYRTPKLEMPEIEAYIIYSGRSIPKIFSSGCLQTDGEGRYILSMNKEFFGGKTGQPEFMAKVIYVKNGSGILEEYIRFSQIFDEQMAKYKHEPAKAAGEIFRICEEEKVLTAYLAEHRAEVEKIMLTMVSPEYIEKSERKVDAIRSTIEDLRFFGHSENEIKERLVKKYSITPGYAQNCLDADWEDEDD